jgi:L-ribulose-5-phosphate 3-epimerase
MINSQNRIGFMQGRLSEPINGRIQTFPEKNWELEFSIASQNKLSKIEWTIDTLTFLHNPIVKPHEIVRIVEASSLYGIQIPSVTCDHYMENPHWDSRDVDIESDVIRIIEAMPKIGASILVIPLVDNSSIAKKQNIDLEFFKSLESYLRHHNVCIAFELDLEPEHAKNFIELFDPILFGINYDVGNSASLGFNPIEEISCYGNRILNVHVKDRLLGGHTVPLGLGNADFKAIVEQLQKANFYGNFIMQTARARDGEHKAELMRNIEFFKRAFVDH